MAGASAEGEQNPWPAFVDVLTTVIMVVTFLLVIMSAAVMQASQAAIDEIRESVSAEAMEAAQRRIQELEAQLAQMTLGNQDGSGAAAVRAVELRQLERAEGDLRRQVASRSQDEEGRFIVQSQQDEPVEGGELVQSADVLFTLEFEPEAVRVGSDIQDQAIALIQRADIPPGAIIEIWSEAPTTSTVSESERLAYYRALVARNILIRAGIPATSITAQIRAIESSEGNHAVRVIVKP
jgi:hypothetical protein